MTFGPMWLGKKFKIVTVVNNFRKKIGTIMVFKAVSEKLDFDAVKE